MSTILRTVQHSWRHSFGRVVGGTATAAIAACCAAKNHTDFSSCEAEEEQRRLMRRRASEGMNRRELVRCVGGDAELEQNYELGRTLGRGGFGSVSRAVHRGTNLTRAIKRVAIQGDDDDDTITDESTEQMWDRMLAEVEALMELDHPNIVRLYEYYRTPRTLYLVEEYCSGGTLEERLQQAGGRFAVDEAAIVLRQMLRGLLCCHAHGLAHRDLKPDNFCYGSTHESAALKMIDFGLSRAPVDNSARLAYVEAAGTLEYTAPETLPARDPATGKLTRAARYQQAADIWSVGAIFFLMLTGEQLFDFDRMRTSSAEMNRLMKNVVQGTERDLLDDAALKVRSESYLRERLNLARRKAPPAACELLEMLLVQDPEKRLTATQALKHRFITDSYRNHPRGHGVFDEKMIPKMRRFADAPALRRLAVLAEAHLLGPQDNDAIRKQILTFRSADNTGLGVLTASDIGTALKSQGLEVPDDLTEICACLDINGDGSINLIEFVASTMEPQLFCEPRLCKAAFRVLDADGDGYITMSDLEAMLTEGPRRSERARHILASAEPDHLGRVDFNRFLKMMLPRDADPTLAEMIAEYMGKSFV